MHSRFQTTTGSPTVVITSGPSVMQPGDMVWSDAFPFGTTVFSNGESGFFTQTSTNNFNVGDSIRIGINTYNFVSAGARRGDDSW